MSIDSVEKQTQNSERANLFTAIVGILSVLAYPIFYFIWDMKPIGAGKYILLLIIFGLLFLALMFAAQRVKIFQDSLPLYLNWIMPAFCVIATFGVGGAFSALGYALALIALHVLFVLVYIFREKFSPVIASLKQVNENAALILAAGYGIIFCVWVVKTYDLLQPQAFSTWIITLLVVTLITWGLWGVEVWQKKAGFKYRYIIYVVSILLVSGLVYRPEFFFDRWHYNYFMAPINDVLHGKVIFVNTTSQYGIGVIYSLALLFSLLRLPLGYEGLSFIVNILFILQYLLLAFMLWEATEDLICSASGGLAMIYFNYLTVYWESMLRTPAQSPLRYGWIYLLLAIALVKTKKHKRSLQVLEAIFVGMAGIWSLETLIYSMAALDAFYFVTDFLLVPQWKSGLKTFAGRIVFQAGIVSVVWGLFYFFVHNASGVFPDIRIYFDYFLLHADRIPLAENLIVPHIFRTGAVLFVYLVSIFAVIFDRSRLNHIIPDAVAAMLVGMSMAGILQYVYYFIFYLDYHLALLCIPLIFVLTLWIVIIRKNNTWPRLFRMSAIIATLASLATVMVVTSSGFESKFSKSLLYTALINHRGKFVNPYHIRPSTKSVEILVGFINKYTGSEREIAIFANPDDQAEALFLTGKTEILGMSESEMSASSLTYSGFILNNAKMIVGQPTYIFYCMEKDCLLPIQQETYQILIAQGNYRIIDQKRGIVVLKKGN